MKHIKITVVALSFIGSVKSQTCEPCVTVEPIPNGNDPDLVGSYKLLDANSGCPEGCGYSKDGSPPSEVWCFQKNGPYPPIYACPSTTSAVTSTASPTTLASTSTGVPSTTGAPTTTSAQTSTGAPTTTGAQTSTTAAQTTTVGTCFSGFSYFNGNCYQVYETTLEWSDASYQCSCNGATALASITSEAENTFITNLLGSTTDAWIGLNDKDIQETYVWTDGTTFSYNNWDDGQPSNTNNKQDCVVIRNSGKWDDVACGGSRAYVCKTSASTASTTVTPVYSCTTPATTTAAATTTFTIPPSDKCDSGWYHSGSKCYKRFSNKVTWDNARISCRCTYSGELASIEDSTNNDLVLLLAGTTEDGTWIGGTDYQTEGTMTWSDGTTWSYENWNDNAPNDGGADGNQDCLIMRETGKWDDVGCSTTRQYVCEKPDSDQTALGSNAACHCDSGWTANLDLENCYKRGFVSGGTDWSSARSSCQTDGGDLASITSALENLVVTNVLNADSNSNNGWIGGTDADTEGTWTWSDGTTWSYENWWTNNAGVVQPSGAEVQNCLQLRWNTAQWDDLSCTGSKEYYVCKVAPTTSSTTTAVPTTTSA